MRRDSDGCFRVTLPPLSPEVYTYCFRVDGKRQPDSLNQDTAWQKTHLWNVLTVTGTPQADLYRQPSQSGQLIRTQWYSSVEKQYRRVQIYLPAGYEQAPCPVLYLIHGINGYEGSWSERGRAIQIMENLVEQGQCRPMILVMPNVNLDVKENQPGHHTLWHNVMNYPRLCRNHDIEKALVELIQMVDTTYRVADQHYIAGFSDGARLAANAANLMPGYFAAIGLFSPVVKKKQVPTTNDHRPTTVYHVYTGKKDMFRSNAKRFTKRLSKAQLPNDYTETVGGHTWRNWRLHLADFLMKINQ